MTRNSTTSVSLENEISMPKISCVPIAMQKAFTTPISTAAKKGARHAAQAADDRDHEGVGDHRQVEVETGRLARQLQRAAQPGQGGADEEHAGEELALVDAQRADHLAVLRRRAHQRAPARAGQRQPQAQQHQRRDDDQRQVVLRHTPAHDLDRAREARRARADQLLGPPDRQRGVLDHQHDGEGGEQLEQFGGAIDAAQDADLEQRAQHSDDKARDDDGAPEPERRAAEELHRRIGDVESQHVERAVREVDDARDAEDQRQAGGHHEQR